MTPERLREALERHPRLIHPPLPGRTNHLDSAVLIPLEWRPGPEKTGPVAIVTVRAAHLRHHAGEICFPGGRPEPGDADLRATALREAEEELGIVGARVVGELSSIPLYTSDYRLHPFVAEIPPTDLTINEDEVALALRVPLGPILARPHIDAIPWQHDDLSGLSPTFELEDDHIMFGATAHAFYELLLVIAPLLGYEPQPLKAGKLRWSDVLPDHLR